MEKKQSSNVYNKDTNNSLLQSSFLNQSQNKYQNLQFSSMSNSNNSLSLNSPFSNQITLQTQLDSSRNFDNINNNINNIFHNNNRQNEELCKTLSTSTLEMNLKDSKPKNIGNIIKKSNMQKKPNEKNNKKNINIEDDSDEDSEDYGNAADDDFDNILRESINIRNTQHNLNLNNINLQNNPKQNQNPFSNKSQKIDNNNPNKNRPIKDKFSNIVNDNKEKMNVIKDDIENRVYNTMNNYFDKIDLESDKKDKKLKNEKKLFNKNIKNDENINNLKKNLNNEQKYVDLNDYFGDNDNLIQQHKEILEDNNSENEYNLNKKVDNNLNNNINNIDLGNANNLMKEDNNILEDDHLNNINYNYNNNNIINNNIDNDNNNIIYNSNDNNNYINNNNNIVTPEANYKIDLDNPETKNQLRNHNIYIDNMLKEMKFLERLKSISDSRYSYFIEKYQKDNYFMEKSQFENIFIDEKNIKVQSPLTLIFHYIFNPDTPLPGSSTNFFETIFTKRGDKNYTNTYDKSELEKIPKYFNDFSYVNNLFYNFNKNNLNSFLEVIKSWKETFTFEQEFIHPLKNFFRLEKSITMKDVAKVYFISPYDLIIDYHSYGSDLPLSDTFVAITQYRFHCDIIFDYKKGKFIFKTSGQIFNTIKIVKENLLKNTIRDESNNTNKAELQINTWPPLKSVIESEDQKNQKNVQKIYEKYLMNNLDKFSKELPKEYDIFFNDNNNNENWNSFSDLSENERNYENENDVNNWKKDLEDKNMIILKYFMIFIIGLLVTKILWSIVNGTFSFRSLFNSFLVILLGYVLIKFRLLNV